MIIRLLAVIALLCLTSTAQAQNAWSAPGRACVPADNAIGLYETGVAYVKHAATETGMITFTCQMDRFNSGTSMWNLKITYRDSTGTAVAGSVVAQVYSMAIGTATPVLLSEVNSNSSPVKATNTLASADLNHTFDFEANTYWVRVTLRRSTTAQTVIFHSVVLDGQSA